MEAYKYVGNKSSTAYDRHSTKILKLSYQCAYCGIQKADRLDHYLPKDRSPSYPEFSVLPANLIPSCAHCNSPRDFRDEARRRALIHPYFDTIPSDRLLVAEVCVKQGVPEAEFHVDLRACTDAAFGQLYERHVRLLGLLKRYHEAAASEIGLSEIERVTRVWANRSSRGDTRRLLSEHAEENERAFGANHFKTALYRGAAASDGFINFCLRSTP